MPLSALFTFGSQQGLSAPHGTRLREVITQARRTEVSHAMPPGVQTVAPRLPFQPLQVTCVCSSGTAGMTSPSAHGQKQDSGPLFVSKWNTCHDCFSHITAAFSRPGRVGARGLPAGSSCKHLQAGCRREPPALKVTRGKPCAWLRSGLTCTCPCLLAEG